TLGEMAGWQGGASAGGLVLFAAALAVVAAAARSLRWRAGDEPASVVVALAGGYAALHLAFMNFASPIVDFDPLGERLLSPAWWPGCLAVVGWLDLWDREARAPSRWRRGCTVAVIALVLVPSFLRAADMTRRAYRDGAHGFATTHWQDSDLVAWLGRHRSEYPPDRLFSNSPESLAYLLGVSARALPSATRAAEGEHPIFASDGLLVWFEVRRWNNLAGPATLEARLELSPLYESGSGTIFVTRPLRPEAPN
ncbi:MAG: hypothetical protein R3190_12385, partial [Thermoanaerobaculia bacterium]|nr:hypothetical protein [Thermoanaerobaculia bacterium]